MTMPERLIEQKLNQLLAAEKLKIAGDPVYHVLADVTALLANAYGTAGVKRAPAQTRKEALEMMLQADGADTLLPLIAAAVARYRDPPDGFTETLRGFIAMRGKTVAAMPPEDRAEAAFAAYLGSLDMTESLWRVDHQMEAAAAVRHDALLDEIAEREQIAVSNDEIEAACADIAAQCGADTRTVMETVDIDALSLHIRRQKAESLYNTKHEGGS